MRSDSLPKSLEWQVPTATQRIDKPGRPPAPRVPRGLLRGALWAAITAMAAVLCWAAWVIHDPPPPPPPPPPLDFDLVVQRFPAVRQSMGRKEVEALLGPPTQLGTGDPELLQAQANAEWSNRHLPREMRWHLWIDPKDRDRWVAVLYRGDAAFRVKTRGVKLPPKPR